ncbi:MAG: metal-dependent transcriptional regulator [Candidatus Helarchaeota archaeon]
MISGLSRKKEDYIKTIKNIIEKQGYARTKDIANELNVKPPSVSEMLKKLGNKGFVVYRKNHPITLTERGENLAKEITEGYQTLFKLLINILVPKDIALKDACHMEHNLHKKTVTQLKKFVDFMECLDKIPKWLIHFRQYCKTGEINCKERQREVEMSD